MALNYIQPSFSKGELSPALFARVDLAAYHVGAALMRNFFVDYRGGTSNRPGTQYIATLDGTGGKPRVIPFEVSTTATYVVVIGVGSGGPYMQFFTNGAYVSGADLVSPYAAADIYLIKYTQSANVLTLTHPLYPVYNLTRTSPTTFVLAADVIGPITAPPTVLVGKSSTGATNWVHSYVVTAVSANGQEESVPCFPVVITGNSFLNTMGEPGRYSITWTASTSSPSYYKIYSTDEVPGTGNVGMIPLTLPSVYGFVGQSVGTSFTDTGITPDFTQTPPLFQDPFSPGQIAQLTVTGGSGYTTTTLIYTLTFTGGGGSGAAGYLLIDPDTGVPAQVVLTNPGKGYTTAPVVTDSGANNATYIVTLGQLTGTYPACVTYFQQRRVFGATTNFPETFVCSQPGNYNNFDASIISLASDSITASIANRQDNTIRSMVTMNTGLVIFTTGGGFLVSGGNQQAAVTPADVVAFPQASSGANDLFPLVVNYDVLYCQNRGFTVRDLAFNFYVQSYTGTDRSVLSSHLFINHLGVDWCYAEEPYRQILTVREDGVMLSFTYVPEQEVFGWAHYDTNGIFASVASVPEGQENAVYTIVQRYIQGTATWTYFLERFAQRTECCPLTPWFVDAALAYEGTPGNVTLQPSGTTGTITLTVVS